jgi:hypothetical protein
MLTDAAWSRLAKQGELLCAECFFARAIERKVPIGLTDVLPCPFNLFHRPLSWFDLFAKGERRKVIEAWLAMANDPEAAR